MRIEDLPAAPGGFVARVSDTVTVVDRRPGHGENSSTANTVFASALVVLLGGEKALQKPPMQGRLSPTMLLSR